MLSADTKHSIAGVFSVLQAAQTSLLLSHTQTHAKIWSCSKMQATLYWLKIDCLQIPQSAGRGSRKLLCQFNFPARVSGLFWAWGGFPSTGEAVWLPV